MQALWLVQLGTPEAPTPRALRAFLGEFLMDPDVIRLPLFLRSLLVRGLIVPLRAPKSAKAYASIWTEEGSPLRVHSENLQAKLQQTLAGEFDVYLGMRY